MDKTPADPRRVLKNKIKAFLYDQRSSGLVKARTDRTGYAAARVFFIISGIFGLFLTMLHGLIVYMALGSGLTDTYRIVYRSFILPTALCFVLVLLAVILVFLKKEGAAITVALAAAVPQIMQLLQLCAEGYKASYKTGLTVMYALLFILQICALIMLLMRHGDARLEKKMYEKALNRIYSGHSASDGVMTQDELLRAIDEYTPKLPDRKKK